MFKNDEPFIIGCEESQTITELFRLNGYECFSCDLKRAKINSDWHFQEDIFQVLQRIKFKLAILHPPCTFLAVSGAQWYYHPEDRYLPYEKRRPHPKYPNRRTHQHNAKEFFMKCINAPVEHLCIENPIGIMSSEYRQPDQIIQPCHFGDEATKPTCLWLKNLPPLFHAGESDLFNELVTHVDKGEFIITKGGNKIPKWYSDAKSNDLNKTREIRSKTFPGIGLAMVEQWSSYIYN